MRTIEVTIDDEGNTSVDLKGFHGKGCHQVMQDFTDPGDTVLKTRTKPDYYQDARQQEKDKVRAKS